MKMVSKVPVFVKKNDDALDNLAQLGVFDK